jgi:hypothetical protein
MERDHLDDQGVDKKSILKWTLQEQAARAETGFQ